jgi:hypothetical protein
MPKGKIKKPAKSAPKSKTKKEKPAPDNIYQIKILLMGIEPPIWRRFLVPASVDLHQLHQILQVIMGWQNSHLHQFVLGADVYADPEMEPEGEMGQMKDEHQFKLGEVLPREVTAITYEYDFGDRWKHLVLVEKIIFPDEPVEERLTCIEGERACPPEDCGGFHGYAEVLDIIFSPAHPDYEAMLDWTGKDFNPEIFNLQTVNARLKELKE